MGWQRFFMLRWIGGTYRLGLYNRIRSYHGEVVLSVLPQTHCGLESWMGEVLPMTDRRKPGLHMAQFPFLSFPSFLLTSWQNTHTMNFIILATHNSVTSGTLTVLHNHHYNLQNILIILKRTLWTYQAAFFSPFFFSPCIFIVLLRACEPLFWLLTQTLKGMWQTRDD